MDVNWRILLNGSIWFLILLLTKGDLQTNKYGERTSYISITPQIQGEYGMGDAPTTYRTAVYIATWIILYVSAISLNSVDLFNGFRALGQPSNYRYNSVNTVNRAPRVETTYKNTSQSMASNTLDTVHKKRGEKNSVAEECTRDLQSYYCNLTNKSFSNAYSYLSDEQRANLGSYDQWRNGYNITLFTTLVTVKAISVSTNLVVYSYRLESKELVDGRIKHQIFTGNITMVRGNGHWVIQSQDGQLVGSSFE